MSGEAVKEAAVAETAVIEREVVEAAVIETAAMETAADETAETATADFRIPIIQVRNLHKTYQVGGTKVYALNGADLAMYKGEFCAIVGPSDSGKPILFNIPVGLEKPSEGKTIIGKTHIKKLKGNELAAFRRRQADFIFQSYNLFQTLNVVENVALSSLFRGVPKKERSAIVKKYLKKVGLGKRIKHTANIMSGGQQQRVNIVRASVVQSQIIFVDEPTRSLDIKTTQEVPKLMCRIVREQNQTLVVVIHDNYITSSASGQFHIVDGKILKIDE